MLYVALADAMGKGSRRLPPPATAFEPLVASPVVSVTSKIFTVLRALRLYKEIGLDKLFSPESGRSSLIATFLAVLELIKSGKICLEEGRLVMAGRIS
jgi:segregation and condensation protein A